MVNQHCKWLEICKDIAWREEISSLNLLITSTVWRQDHNGFTHQDPGFLDVVVNKSPEVVTEQIACCNYAYEHGIDKLEMVNWKGPY
jgi:phosphoketolase